jgi:hypothetical protein
MWYFGKFLQSETISTPFRVSYVTRSILLHNGYLLSCHYSHILSHNVMVAFSAPMVLMVLRTRNMLAVLVIWWSGHTLSPLDLVIWLYSQSCWFGDLAILSVLLIWWSGNTLSPGDLVVWPHSQSCWFNGLAIHTQSCWFGDLAILLVLMIR